MRIAIIGSKGFDTLEFHLADSFRFLGHDVKIYDMVDVSPLSYKYNYFASKYLNKYTESLFLKLAKKTIEFEPDLVVCTYRIVHPSFVDYVKKNTRGCKIIHVNPDQMTTLERQQIFVSDYDAYFTKDKYIEQFMKAKMGLNVHYLPESFNPRVHKKPSIQKEQAEKEVNIDVLNFGNTYPYRGRMLKKLVEAGLNLTIYGSKDSRFSIKELEPCHKNVYITGEEKSYLLYGAKVVFNNFHFAEIDGANCKFFEINGVGAFQICDYKSVLTEYSDIAIEKYTFKTIDEAVELIKFYLDKPALRHEIAQKQYEHFLKHHTYEHRTTKILDIVMT